MSAVLVRILLAHPAGQTPGDGVAALARALRDAGHEVIQAGAQAPRQLVAAAIQEDVDLLIVCSQDAVPGYADEVSCAAEESGADDVTVRVVSPDEQLPALVAWVHEQVAGAQA